MSSFGELLGVGFDIWRSDKELKLKREETGVKEKLAEVELARQKVEIAKYNSESSITALNNANIQKIAIISSISIMILSILFLIFKR